MHATVAAASADPEGASGLRQASWALADQVRAVDKRRVVLLVGRVADAELAAIERGMALFPGMLS